jgi:D-inositol-3-phosphate glycosyltransferase
VTPAAPARLESATRLAVLSVHTCPLAALGGKETGGMNVYVRELSRALGRLGFAVDVFTRSQDPGIPEVVALGPGARVVHVPAGPARPIARAAVAEHLPEFAAGVEAFRAREGVRYDLVHSHYWLSGLAGLDLRRRWDTPLVHMFHTLGAIKNAVAGDSGDTEPAERLEAEVRIAAAADRIVASNLVERAGLVWHLQADPARVAVIPCGVDVELFRPRPAAPARVRLGLDAEHVLLFVGRLTPIKGLETLLRALAVLRSDGLASARLTLLVVGGTKGDPGDSVHLRRLAQDLGVASWVDFRGPQPQDSLPDYYAAADLCLMPSRYESFGMVALEAMASGVPVIASRAGGLTVTVQDGITGRLVPEGDVAALAHAVKSLLADDAPRRALGVRAVGWARRFTWPAVGRSVAELYAELLPAASGVAAGASRCQFQL